MLPRKAPPRSALVAFLGFDPDRDEDCERLDEAPARAPLPHSERELRALTTAGEASARMRGSLRIVLETQGLAAAIAALDRARVDLMEDARAMGITSQSGWIT